MARGRELSHRDLARSVLLDHFDRERVLDLYEAAPGDEIASGKFANLASSAALAANTFGPGLSHPETFNNAFGSLTVLNVDLEAVVRFPWRGGRHPCLDALLTSEDTFVGIESKRYEPFRSKSRPEFSSAFDRPVWDQLERFNAVRLALKTEDLKYKHLDAAQLIKHALGLYAQAANASRKAVLVYLFAEPDEWPDGQPVSEHAKQSHRAEVSDFSRRVSGDAVEFRAISYRELFDNWRGLGGAISDHAGCLADHFDV